MQGSPRANSGKWSAAKGGGGGAGGGQMTEAEAIAAQQQMFAEARARMNSGMAALSPQAVATECKPAT